MASLRSALLLPLAGVLATAATPVGVASAQAGPVVCTTTLEAPMAAGAAPQEVSRCGPVQTVGELVEQRFFTYTAPFSEGVSLRGQLRDLFGVATGSINRGNAINALGFADQTIVWDGTALQNTYAVLLETQSDLQPWRSPDLSNGFGCSLAAPGACGPATSAGRGVTYRTPVRGLW